ncbi:MAG TPA: hypothetical protein VHG69_13210 [Thermoleophilaceae bacterium]|nr:hypothetical protein [Thermoleophilaceae bacterium]
MGRLRLLGTASLFACLIVAAPALGATPVQMSGAGAAVPDIAVDAGGTAHIVWVDGVADPEVAGYCQLVRGGGGPSNCEALSGSAPFVGTRAHVFTRPNEVIVAHGRFGPNVSENGLWSDRSVDNGLTFPPANRSRIADRADPAEAVYGPGDTITTITEFTTGGAIVQNAPAFNAGVPETDEAVVASTNSEEAAIGLHEGRPVAVYDLQVNPGRLAWRMHSSGDINVAANWGAEQTITSDGITTAFGPSLAGGSNGLFLFWQQTGSPDTGWVSKFTGSGWSPPVQIVGEGFGSYDLHQDPAGRLHAIWDAGSAIRYRSSDDGVNWSPAVDIARGGSYGGVRVAAAADHQGFAVWDSPNGVMAVPLEALPAQGGGSDTTRPVVSGFGIGDRTLLPGQGTVFTFNSSEAGTATLTIERRVPGLRLRQRGRTRCLQQTRRRLRNLRRSLARQPAVRRLRGRARSRRLAGLIRRRRCRAFRRIGRITQVVTPGRNTIVFSGRVAGRRLRPGRYRARLVIRDAAGNVSRTETVLFQVLRPRRAGRR